jgi:hypothetical protein
MYRYIAIDIHASCDVLYVIQLYLTSKKLTQKSKIMHHCTDSIMNKIILKFMSIFTKLN